MKANFARNFEEMNEKGISAYENSLTYMQENGI